MEESQDLAAAITRRLRALQTYSLPQLAGCHSDTTLYDELAGDISQNTQIIERELEVSLDVVSLSIVVVSTTSETSALTLFSIVLPCPMSIDIDGPAR